MSGAPAGLSPAGFWKRYVAYSLDVTLLGVVLLPLLWLFCRHDLAQLPGQFHSLQQHLSGLIEQSSNDGQEPLGQATQMANDPRLTSGIEQLSDSINILMLKILAIVILPAAFYFVGFEASARQATLGKQLIGIKVTDLRGQRISKGRALGRFLAASLSWLTMNLGHALAAWTRERRALHDYCAGTRVENADAAQSKMPLWGWLVVAAHAVIFLLSTIAISAMIFAAMQKMTEGM